MSVSGAESGTIGAVAGAVVTQLVVASALFAWGRWVARRHGSPGWRRAAWMPLIALGLSLTGVLITSALLVRAFGAIAAVDPAQKASVLAQQISEAMNATAVFLVPSLLLYGASVMTFAAGSILRPRQS